MEDGEGGPEPAIGDRTSASGVASIVGVMIILETSLSPRAGTDAESGS